VNDTLPPVRFEALGIGIGLSVDDPSLRDAVATVYGAFPRIESEVPIRLEGGLAVTEEGTFARLGTTTSVHKDSFAALRALNHMIVDAVVLERRDLMHFHAAVFEHRGLGIVVVGAAGAGKSSLTLAFCEAGATFLSDELLPFDPTTGVALAFPRAPKLRTVSRPSFPWAESVSCGFDDATFVDPLRLPGAGIGTATRPRVVLFPTSEAGPGARCRGLTPGEAAIEASLSALNFGSHGPEAALAGFSALTSPCRSFEVRWSNPRAARDAVLWTLTP
jgi:hypothetical protein